MEYASILSDEGGIFDILAGRYSNGVPNLDVLLQSYSGSPVRVNRGSRPPLHLQAPALTIGLCPQPDVLKEMARQPCFRGRGLIGRFLYAIPPSTLGYRTLNMHPISEAIKQEYRLFLHSLLQHPFNETNDRKKNAHIIEIHPQAFERWKKFEKEVEHQMREGEKYAHITDWAGKISGTVIRIAGLLHVAQFAYEQPWIRPIEEATMKAAIRIGEAAGAHALAVYDRLGADRSLESARLILNWIKRNGQRIFSFRECHQALRARFKKNSDMYPAIEILEERSFIKEMRCIQNPSHRPSQKFEVNPLFLAEANK